MNKELAAKCDELYPIRGLHFAKEREGFNACYEEMQRRYPSEYIIVKNRLRESNDREAKLVAALTKIEKTKCCPSCMLDNIQSSLIARDALAETKV